MGSPRTSKVKFQDVEEKGQVGRQIVLSQIHVSHLLDKSHEVN